MKELKQLSREDVMFVASETDVLYQHVGLLMMLETDRSSGVDYARFRDHCMARVVEIPQFQWKLHPAPLGLDRPYWVEDDHFDCSHHIKRIALPGRGDHAVLREVAAELYARHLDRSKPLWEIWFIEGLRGGGYACLLKFHHCIADGEGALKILQVLCDPEPAPADQKRAESVMADAYPGRPPSYKEASSRALAHMARLPGEAARSAFGLLRPLVTEQLVMSRWNREPRERVPTALFNGQLCSERAFASASLPIDALKTVKFHCQVTLNDVVLALVSTAVRAYLLERSALPTEPLRTNIPVSLRAAGDNNIGNNVTNTSVTLATHLEDPLERLRAIHLESELAKQKAHSGGKGAVELFQVMPPVLINTLMASMPVEQAPQLVGANLIVSNIRGASQPLYLAGARMDAMHPLSVLIAGVGLNFTCISYVDQMEFGIVVDPALVPDCEDLGRALVSALDEYLGLCEPSPTRRARKSPGKPRRKKRAATR